MPPKISLINDRLSATQGIDAKLATKVRLPAAVFWNRLEGRPRSQDLARPLRAEVRDPAWMLARQWQFGEFEGEDAGAPVHAKLLVKSVPLTSMRIGNAPPAPWDSSTPIEFLAERQPVEPDLVSGIYLGRRWLRMLMNAFGAADAILNSFRNAYAIKGPADDANDLESIRQKSSLRERQLRSALSNQSLDGAAILAEIRQAALLGKSAADAFKARGVSIDAARSAAIDGLAAQLLTWFDTFFGVSDADSDAWIRTRLEYNFQLSAEEPDGTQSQFVADQFPGGRVDWYSFDVATQPAAAEAPPSTPAKVVRSFVPAPVQFFGAPSVRWWQFEDNRVGFGITTASKTDLVKMLLAEFGLVFSNDWFLIPLRADVGLMLDSKGIVVTDNFGFNTLVEPVAKRHSELQLAGKWRMWNLSRRDQQDQVDDRFFLTPALELSQESAPLDEVAFLRDEMANLVWGVENVIPDPLGGGRDGRIAASELTQAILAAYPPPPGIDPRELADVLIRYQLMGSVPANWIPFVSVKPDGQAVASILLQGAMPRIPVIQPALAEDGTPVLVNNVVLPRGTILARDPVANPNLIHEEEILRDGILVRRTFRQARWTRGRSFLWSALRKQTGMGEGSSGLAFDLVVQKAT